MKSALESWIQHHPILWPVLFGVFLCFVGVFNTDIRAFLSVPPQRLRVWWLRSRIRDAQLKLFLLEEFKKSDKFLIAFVGRSILGSLMVALPGMVCLWVGIWGSMHRERFAELMFFVGYCSLLVTLGSVWSEVRRIKLAFPHRYESAKKDLEKRLHEYDCALDRVRHTKTIHGQAGDES